MALWEDEGPALGALTSCHGACGRREEGDSYSQIAGSGKAEKPTWISNSHLSVLVGNLREQFKIHSKRLNGAA